jgi:hypothetical protein
MSDQSGPAAHDDSRHLPDQLNLRHSKLEAKRRLAAGEFTTLHDAQLAVAREHGMSSWAALKEHITAAEAAQGHALAQVRWVLGRYGEAGMPGWTAPDRDELGEHLTEHFLTLVGPETAAAILRSVAPKLREDLVILDAGPLHLHAAERGRAVVDRAGPGSLRVRLAEPAARGTRRAGAAPARRAA